MQCKRQYLYSNADADEDANANADADMPMPTCRCRDLQMAGEKLTFSKFDFLVLKNL